MSQPDDRPAWLPAPPPTAASPPPPPDAQYVPQSPDEAPAWVTPQPKGSRIWIYLTGVLMIIVLAGGGIWLRGQLLANQQDQLAAQSAPTPLISDYERADRFLNVELAPAFVAVVPPLQSVEKDCAVKTMVPACKPDLIATDKALLGGEDVLNQQRDIPVCIGPQVNQLKNDWMVMEQGVGLAISGFNDNSYDLYLQGMVRFAELAQYIQADMDRITNAEKTCSKTV